jgi:Flp pilus assembly pilin Flp
MHDATQIPRRRRRVHWISRGLTSRRIAARQRFDARRDDERGGSLVEYVLLVAFIALVVLVSIKVLGRTISLKFSSAAPALQ